MSGAPSASLDPELLGKLYETLEEPSLWPEVVQEMTAFSGGLIGGLQFRRLAPELSSVLISSGLEPEFHRAYVDHYYQHDPHLSKVGLLVAGATVRSRDVIPDDDFARTTFFNEFCRPQGVRDLLGAMIIREPELVVSFAMYAPRSRPFDEQSRARLDALVPHLCRVLRIGGVISRAQQASAVLDGAHRTLGAAVLRVDRALRVQATFGATDTHLAAATCELSVTDGMLHARRPADTEHLRGAVAKAFSGYSSRLDFGVATSVLTVPAAPRGGLHADDTVSVILLPCAGSGPGATAVLSTVPPALRRVAVLIAQGLADKEIAERLGMTTATARTYASRLMRRLGAHGRRELMLLLR